MVGMCVEFAWFLTHAAVRRDLVLEGICGEVDTASNCKIIGNFQ